MTPELRQEYRNVIAGATASIEAMLRTGRAINHIGAVFGFAAEYVYALEHDAEMATTVHQKGHDLVLSNGVRVQIKCTAERKSKVRFVIRPTTFEQTDRVAVVRITADESGKVSFKIVSDESVSVSVSRRTGLDSFTVPLDGSAFCD